MNAFAAHLMFIEPQWSVANEGAGYPKWQIFVGFNVQFEHWSRTKPECARERRTLLRAHKARQP